MAVIIDKDLCIGCGICVDECPQEALRVEDNIAVVNEDACIECGICIGECPQEAISL